MSISTKRRGTAALLLAAALSLAPRQARAENGYDIILWILLGGTVAATSLTVGTWHSLEHLSTDDPPKEGLMGFQLATAAPVGLIAHGVLVSQARDKGHDAPAVRGVFLVIAGWADALSGFAIGSFASPRGQDRILGASIGLSTAATSQAVLRLAGGESSESAAGIEAFLATAGIADGLVNGLGPGSRGTRAAYLSYAGFSTLVMAHGILDAISMREDAAPTSRSHVARAFVIAPAAFRTDTSLVPGVALGGRF